MNSESDLLKFLKNKALWVRKETLKIHKIAPETRLASSLSDIEIFVALYYGKVLRFIPNNIEWEERDRFIISKGHGAISLYPILADLGFFSMDELNHVCHKNSFLGSIPDNIPGFETINGSLGHGLGVASGIAIGLRRKKIKSYVFVLVGDGEIYEGSFWEAVMFCSHHRLDNLILIVDANKISMLDYTKNIIDLEPLSEKFKVFSWEVKVVDGHNIFEVYSALKSFQNKYGDRPKVLIADTIKGKGVAQLERDTLCHLRSLTADECDNLIKDII